MKKSFEEYQLLEGSHGLKGSVWRGKDHLLVIEGKGFLWAFSEHYRRIDFKNIQALVMVRSSRWIWLALLFSLGVLVLGLLSWVAYDSDLTSLATTLGVAAGGVGLILVAHLARGKSCRCFVQTAVQVLRLKPLRRESRAKKVFADLEALCREHQGGALVAESMRTMQVPSSGGNLPAMPSQVAGKKDWLGSAWVRVAGVATVLWGLIVAGELWVPGMWFLLIDVMIGLVGFVLTTIGLTRVMRAAAPSGLKVAMWMTIGLQVLIGILMYVAIVAAGVMAGTDVERTEPYSEAEVIQQLADASANDVGAVVYLGFGLGLVLVVLGIMIVQGGWRRKAPSTANLAGVGIVPPAMPGAMEQPVAKSEIPLQNESKEG